MRSRLERGRTVPPDQNRRDHELPRPLLVEWKEVR
jgi:hypothetical protein